MNKSLFLHGLLISLLGSFLGTTCIKAGIDTQSFLTTAIPAQGFVIDVLKSPSTKPKQRITYYNYRLLIKFTPQQGKLTTFESNTSNNLPSYTKGQQVEVLYNHENPQSAMINSWDEIWGGLTFATGLSSVFVLCRLWLMFTSFPSKRRN
ncbi:DUF3592 domain-containing protein [Anabaena sp. WFMT]|uniref:DUF3592 domain-containing protein n=1 Tax=Anabaena sp. WFMT TaxID=3449730 RepID=UPI003F296ADE